MRDDETPTFDLGAEVAKATADYLADRAIPGVDFEIPASIRKPSFPEFVQDLAAQLLVIIDDTDAEMVKERERLATALYDEATRIINQNGGSNVAR